MRNLTILITLLSLVIFTGCTPTINPRIVTHTSMGALDVGMSPEQAQEATGSIPKPEFHFELDGQQWSAFYYLHHSGDAISRYMALYDETGLRYWGFLHEFERQRDEQITAASRLAEKLYATRVIHAFEAKDKEESDQW